jgi:hypothetical protein
VAIAVVVALAIGLIAGHVLPDYDATYALIWGSDIFHGRIPDYSLPFRPAGHPLTTLVGVIGAPFGREGAAELLRWVALLGAGAFVASAFRLGRVLFGTAAGVVVALLLFTRSPLWGFSELAFMDAWAAAFVVWAAALEARTPRRGAPVFVLLALAGLLRPEVWVFAVAYWVWIAIGSRSRALRLIPLAALAPLVWIAWDLATAHSFLGSVSTSEGLPVATSAGGHGLGRVPDALARFIGGFMRPPEAAAAVAGAAMLALAAGGRAARPATRLAVPAGRVAIPVALVALNVITFAIVAYRKGPLEQRYLLVAAGVLLVLSAYAIARGAPRPLGWLLALACLAYAPVDVARLGDVRAQVRTADAVYSDLRDVIEARAGRCTLSGYVHVPDVRLRPLVAYWGGIPPARVGTDARGSADVVALNALARELSSRSLPADPDASPPRGRSWRLAGPCARQ